MPAGELGPRYLPVRSSLERLRSFVEPIEIHVAGCGIEISERRLGIRSLRFRGAFDAALIPARSLRHEAGGQTVRVERARIGLCPQVEGLERQLEIAGDLAMIGRGDEEPFIVGGPLAKLERPRCVLNPEHGLAGDAVHRFLIVRAPQQSRRRSRRRA